MSKKLIFCLLVVLLINVSVFAGSELEKRINGLVSQPSQKNVSYSVKIIEADSGKMVYGYNAEKLLIPASNMKVVTTAAAVHFLGTEFEYVTKVGLCGNSLVVIGSGDPLLGDEKTDNNYGRARGWIFADIADKLQKAGVSSVQDIVVDGTIFDDQRVHPNWPVEQLNQWYACEICGLNYNDNCIAVTVKKNGGTTDIITEPATGFITFINQVKVITSGNSAVGAYRTPGKPNYLVVRGKCKKEDGPFDVAIERPAAFFGVLLGEKLRSSGIEIKGQVVEKGSGAGGDFKLIAEYKTLLVDCLNRANTNSLGIAAEALLKTIAAGQGADRKAGSWELGRGKVAEYLKGLGVSSEGFVIDDGSGLSRENKLSADVLCSVLSDMYKRPFWPKYKDSLAVGGVDGTIGKYFGESKYKGKVHGKTGYIAGVKSFSGYCETPNGGYIFSIITNNANGNTRGIINDIVKAVFDNQ